MPGGFLRRLLGRGEPGAAALAAWREGLALWDSGAPAEARAKLERAIAAAPGQGMWHNEFGLVCLALDDLGAAEAAFRLALKFEPDLAEAECNLGIVLQQRTDSEAARASALAHFRRAARLRPSLLPAQYNCGLLLHKMARADESVPCFDRTLALDPGHADAWRNRGYALQDLRRFDAAQASFERALEVRPDYHEARLSLAFLQLLRGRFREGWQNYRAREFTPESPLRPFPCPDWDGGPLAGRTLLVYAEQGLGDEILFASCVPDLVAQARHVVLDCEPRLSKLFARSFPQASVHGGPRGADNSWLSSVPQPDCKIAAGSVPGFLRNEWKDFPVRGAFLTADGDRVTFWKSRLDALGPGLKIGIAWRGGLPQTRTALRSLKLGGLLPVLRQPGARFVSLQHGDTAEEIAALQAEHGITVANWEDAHADYDETAALIMALDQVVTVCTSIVHLAGALGKTALVMTPFVPEWRYLADGEGMPWYRSVRLIRQSRRGDWSDVFAQVCRCLSPGRDEPAAFAAESGATAARQLLERRIESFPEDAGTHRELAQLAFENGELEAAIDAFELALHFAPGDVDALTGLARALRLTGRAADAEGRTREALACAPTLLAPRLELAAALKAQDRIGEAIAEYRSLLANHGGSPAVWCNLGVALHLQAEFEEAVASLSRALELDPDFAEAQHNLGLALRELGDIEGALAAFRRALALKPGLLATHGALAHTLRDLGRIDEALAEYDRVLADRPQDGDALLNRAYAFLMRGDYVRGWDEYEKRMAAGGFAPRPFALPRWDGGATGGRRVLVVGEQGLGDEIMFASCIPDLIAREGWCVIECNARLAPLYSRSFGVPVHGGGKQDDSGWIQAYADLGWQIQVGSLPRLFRREATAFALAAAGFLKADPVRTAEWRARFDSLGAGGKIGVSWRGGGPRTRGRLRSMALSELAPLCRLPGFRIVSLQHGDTEPELTSCASDNGMLVAGWPGTGADLDALAAMIAGLDLVVTIDNTVAHLAGALGKPVWILLARGAEWRYGCSGETTPWYPSARLFRQEAAGWPGVIARVARALLDEGAQRA